MAGREQNVSQPFPNVIKTSLSPLAISKTIAVALGDKSERLRCNEIKAVNWTGLASLAYPT